MKPYDWEQDEKATRWVDRLNNWLESDFVAEVFLLVGLVTFIVLMVSQ